MMGPSARLHLAPLYTERTYRAVAMCAFAVVICKDILLCSCEQTETELLICRMADAKRLGTEKRCFSPKTGAEVGAWPVAAMFLAVTQSCVAAHAART